MLAPIFEDEGLFDERPCESGCRSANTKDFAGKPLVIGRLAGRERASNLSLSKALPWNVNTFGFTRAASITCILRSVHEDTRGAMLLYGDGPG